MGYTTSKIDRGTWVGTNKGAGVRPVREPWRQPASLGTLAAITLTVLTACVVPARAQFPPRQFQERARLGRNFPNPARRAAIAQALADRSDKEAVALLRLMLRPSADYSADEQTSIAQGSMGSRQRIKGDIHGNVVRYYLSPAELNGDVMITGPNRYAYYRASTRTLTEVPPTGGPEDDRDKHIVDGIRQRIFVAKRTGNETVAGVNATIVLVSPANPQQQGYAKFWIDPVTHIKLKMEIANAANVRVSTSELSNLTVGAAANVSPRDFQPVQFGAAREVKRERVGTLQEAIARLQFRPVQPASLPAGFRLDGIQVITGPLKVGLLLRYTDGVTVFTLAEHQVRAGRHPVAAAAAVPPRWFVSAGNYDVEVVYRGHLPAQQEQAVRDSLQVVR